MPPISCTGLFFYYVLSVRPQPIFTYVILHRSSRSNPNSMFVSVSVSSSSSPHLLPQIPALRNRLSSSCSDPMLRRSSPATSSLKQLRIESNDQPSNNSRAERGRLRHRRGGGMKGEAMGLRTSDSVPSLSSSGSSRTSRRRPTRGQSVVTEGVSGDEGRTASCSS